MQPISDWQPTDAQREQWDRDGYFVVRGLLPSGPARELRGVIRDTILRPEPGARADADPMDPMGDSPAAREARFRKLGDLGLRSPLAWDLFYAGETVLPAVRWCLRQTCGRSEGDDILLKFNSVFLKPARTGSATPWHQDNGLWRDGETQPANAWMAIDPATRANGCLQFLPGSHRTEIVPHVLYEDSVHGELPRERVEEAKARFGLAHIELEPGDAVFWHSSLWHYSPPNTSDRGRIGMAGVWTVPSVADVTTRFKRTHWVARGGRRLAAFPPEPHEAPGEATPLPPFPKKF